MKYTIGKIKKCRFTAERAGASDVAQGVVCLSAGASDVAQRAVCLSAGVSDVAQRAVCASAGALHATPKNNGAGSLVISATGEYGRLTIKIFSLELIHVRYDIDSIKISEAVEQASKMLCGAFAEKSSFDKSCKSCKSAETDSREWDGSRECDDSPGLDGSRGVGIGFSFNCQETDDYFYAECISGSDNVLVSINKENANVTVERNGKIIHGGEIGTKDTVLPREQFRYFTTEQNAKTGRASFFFPLAKDDRFYGLGDKAGYPDARSRPGVSRRSLFT